MKNIKLLFVILLLLTVPIFGAISYEIRVVQTVNGNILDMDIQIMNTGDPFVLSTSTFYLDFPISPTRFSNPQKGPTDGPWDAQTDPDYNNIIITSDINNGWLGIAVEFAGGDDNNGLTVPNSWTTIGTMQLTITDPSQSSGLTWRQIGSVTQVTRLTSPGVLNGGSTNITSSGTFDSPNNQALPVELSSFSISVNSNNVNLNWKTATEVNNNGFEVQREVRGQKSEVSN